jgi:hypothetical protein
VPPLNTHWGLAMTEITQCERAQIKQILRRRANEVADFAAEYTKDSNHLGSVELALTREIERLRHLAGLMEEDGDD